MKLNKFKYAIALMTILVLASCVPKDGTSLPSPNAKMSEIIEHVTFSPSARDSVIFRPRFYIVDEEANRTRLTDGVSFFFLRKNVSETLQGARTVVFVPSRSDVVGEWVTPILKQKKGIANSEVLRICILI